MNLLLAESDTHAIAYAEIDWKWPRLSPNIYQGPDGTPVRIVRSVGDFYRIPTDTIVYLAHGWQRNIGLAELARAMASRGRIRLEEVKPNNGAL